MGSHRKRRLRSLVATVLVTALTVGVLAVFLLGRDPDTPSTGATAWERPDYHNSGVLGDVDGDGKVSDDEATDLATTMKTAQEVVLGKHSDSSPGTTSGDGPAEGGGLAATKGIDSLIVTPAGAQWWSFLTDMATDLAFWDAPAPAGVDWYALTEGRSYLPNSDRLVRYHALHLVFPSTEDAEQWQATNALDGHSGNVYQTVRGRVLTITPSWVDLSAEPYGPIDELAASGAQVKVGLWQVDYAEEYRNQIREVTDPQAYQAMWTALGFADATSWVATSPRPDADWVGHLTGFDPDAVDGFAVVAAINTSVFYCQDGQHDCRTGDPGTQPDPTGRGVDSGGISEAINEIYVADSHGHGGGEETLMPTSGHSDAALTFTYSGAFRGMINETMARNSATIDRFETWVSEDGLLTVHPVFRQVDDIAAESVS